jgi:hypothetical protein
VSRARPAARIPKIAKTKGQVFLFLAVMRMLAARRMSTSARSSGSTPQSEIPQKTEMPKETPAAVTHGHLQSRDQRGMAVPISAP